MLSSNCLLSPGVTAFTDKPLQFNEVTLLCRWFQCGVRGVAKVLLRQARGTQDSFLVPKGSSLCSPLHLSPLIVAWTLSSFGQSFHVLKINSVPFSMQSECGSFISIDLIFFSFGTALKSSLTSNPGVEKVMKTQEVRHIRSKTGLTFKNALDYFKGKQERKHTFLDSLEGIDSNAASNWSDAGAREGRLLILSDSVLDPSGKPDKDPSCTFYFISWTPLQGVLCRTGAAILHGLLPTLFLS